MNEQIQAYNYNDRRLILDIHWLKETLSRNEHAYNCRNNITSSNRNIGRCNGFVDNRKMNENFVLHDATPETTEIIATDGFDSCECRSTELARHTHIRTHMRTREGKSTTMTINRL